jgi:hypothetical protein
MVLAHEHSHKTAMKNRHEDQKNRMEDPDTNSPSYSHLIFDKSAQICAGEKTASSTNGSGKIGFPPAED